MFDRYKDFFEAVQEQINHSIARQAVEDSKIDPHKQSKIEYYKLRLSKSRMIIKLKMKNIQEYEKYCNELRDSVVSQFKF